MSYRPDPNKPPIQDMPPKGGFRPIDFFPKARNRGPSGVVMWAVAVSSMAWGYYRIGVQNHETAANKYLEERNRALLAPIFQAQEDILYAEQRRKDKEYEYELMKDIDPNFEPCKNVYLTKRWAPYQTGRVDRWNR